jgi:hypothetical protein
MYFKVIIKKFFLTSCSKLKISYALNFPVATDNLQWNRRGFRAGLRGSSIIFKGVPIPPNDAQNSPGSEPSVIGSAVLLGEIIFATSLAWSNSSELESYFTR